MNAILKVRFFLVDLMGEWRRAGFRVALRHLLCKVFERPENLLYACRAMATEPGLPSGWTIHALDSEADPKVALARQCGQPLANHHFRQGATAFVLFIGDEAVGHRWHFRGHPLARRLGPEVAYFGDAFVRPAWRGRNISGLVLHHMLAQLPTGSRAVLEVEMSNTPSQRSLVRNGCVLMGRVRTTVLFNRILSVRILPQSEHPDGKRD